MAVLKFLVVTSVLVVFVAYYNRPVFPDTASNRGLKTMVGLGYKFIRLMTCSVSCLGFSRLNISRWFVDLVVTVDQTPGVISYKTHFDKVEVRIFNPTVDTEDLRPGIVHFHGGGWVLGSPDLYGSFIEQLVVHSQAVVVSVNYRLSPEHKYPLPLEDCLAATRFFLRNAEKYGVDANLVGVKGDSAGGNLAMAVALKLSTETDLPSLKFMSLDYPPLQAFDFMLPSYTVYEHGPQTFLRKKDMIEFWLYYGFGDLKYYDLFHYNRHIVDDLQDSDYPQFVSHLLLPKEIRETVRNSSVPTKTVSAKENVLEEIKRIIADPFYAPLMASEEQLERLPPTYLFIVEFDVLRDDSLIVARRLENSGVKITRRFVATEEHAYLNFVVIDSSVKAEIEKFAVFFNQTLNLGGKTSRAA